LCIHLKSILHVLSIIIDGGPRTSNEKPSQPSMSKCLPKQVRQDSPSRRIATKLKPSPASIRSMKTGRCLPRIVEHQRLNLRQEVRCIARQQCHGVRLLRAIVEVFQMQGPNWGFSISKYVKHVEEQFIVAIWTGVGRALGEVLLEAQLATVGAERGVAGQRSMQQDERRRPLRPVGHVVVFVERVVDHAFVLDRGECEVQLEVEQWNGESMELPARSAELQGGSVVDAGLERRKSWVDGASGSEADNLVEQLFRQLEQLCRTGHRYDMA
jgi:hypothetical protein